jgi:hypothetical protein
VRRRPLAFSSTSEEAGRAVGEIAHAVGDVASGAERQARSVESVRSVIEEMALVTRQSSEHLRETGEAAGQASWRSGLRCAVLRGPANDRARALDSAAVVEQQYRHVLLAGERDDLLALAAATQRNALEAANPLDREAVTRALECLCRDAARVRDQRYAGPVGSRWARV